MPFYPYVGARDADAHEHHLACCDPEHRIDARLAALLPFDGGTVLDIGAGSGVHACRLAARAGHVFALEPDAGMRRQMHHRLSAADAPTTISVLAGGAEHIPLPDRSIDLIHARFAYFFGTDACLPGLAEAARVGRPGGGMVVLEAAADCPSWTSTGTSGPRRCWTSSRSWRSGVARGSASIVSIPPMRRRTATSCGQA